MNKTRRTIVNEGIIKALGNASVTVTGLVQLVHSSHHDIKTVSLVRKHDDMRQFTFVVRYHDRNVDSYKFNMQVY